MEIQLSDHFNYKKLLRFTLPSIIMMIFTSVYSIVDGFFVSNFAGQTAFAAVNFAMPVVMIMGTGGFMLGTGGSAIVAKMFGEKKDDKAIQYFSLFVAAAAILGVILAVIGFIFFEKFMVLLGANGTMLENATLYGRIVLIALPAYSLQCAFQTFFVTAEKPKLGLKVTVIAGVANIILDAVFVGALNLGFVGAAMATGIGQCIGGILPLIYFSRKNNSKLRLVKPVFDGKILLKACTNGSSELMSNIAMSLINMLYNYQLLKFAGENGVSAYGVLMYVNMIFLAIFIGYSTGSAPIVSYNYGAQNIDELQDIRKKSITIIGITSIVMFALSLILAEPLGKIFVGYDEELLTMTVHGFNIYAFSFIFCGISIWASSFFTALNNGVVSAILSFVRTLVFQVASVLILPIFLGLDGIWLSIVVAEVLASILSIFMLKKMQKTYHY